MCIRVRERYIRRVYTREFAEMQSKHDLKRALVGVILRGFFVFLTEIYGILRERVTTGRLYNPNPTSTLAIEASANYSSVGSVRLTSYDLKLIRWGQPTKGIERCRGGLKATHSKGGVRERLLGGKILKFLLSLVFWLWA